MPDVLFATCAKHPGLHEDDHPLLEELARRGMTFRCLVWDDPAADWTAAPLTMIRSTWDYTPRHDAYLAWSRRVGAGLWNPAPVIEWNTDKRYLKDLEAAGIDIVPTAWFERGAKADLAKLAADRDWEAIVVKPVVSADALGALKAERADFARAQEHLDRLLAAEAVMVQPYLRTVEGHGERSQLFLDGVFSHSVRKQPAFRPKTAEADPAVSDAGQIRVARNILEVVARRFPGLTPLLYARVDLLPDERGTLRVMELELTEPTLFFREGGPGAVAKVADGLARRLAAG